LARQKTEVIRLSRAPALTVGHLGAMVEPGKKAPGGPGLSGSQVLKRRAEVQAAAYSSTIQEFRSAGFVSRRSLADELNRRGIPTARGGSWHYTTVVRMLTRLGLITSGKGRINIGQATKQAADARAKALASTIGALQAQGLVSFESIARELNGRKIPAARGGKWHPTSAGRLLHRLERLEPSSRTVVTPDE
jgi:hypothetical protein